MQTKTFICSKSNQRNIAFLFLGLGVLGAALALYLRLWAYSAKSAFGSPLLAVPGIIVFFKLMFAPKKENETAITVSDKGITATTTSIAKVAGPVEWAYIEDI